MELETYRISQGGVAYDIGSGVVEEKISEEVFEGNTFHNCRINKNEYPSLPYGRFVVINLDPQNKSMREILRVKPVILPKILEGGSDIDEVPPLLSYQNIWIGKLNGLRLGLSDRELRDGWESIVGPEERYADRMNKLRESYARSRGLSESEFYDSRFMVRYLDLTQRVSVEFPTD